MPPRRSTRAPASQARKTAGGRDAEGGRHQEQAGRAVPVVRPPSRSPAAAEPGERRHALATALDERRAAGQEERHVRAELRREPLRGSRRPASTPHASSAASTAAAASDEPPASPAATGIRFSRRAARAGGGSVAPAAPGGRRAGPRRSPAGRGCRRPGPGRSPSTWRVSRGARRQDRHREPVREVERDHDAVQVVIAVRAHAEHRQREVDLGRREAHDGARRRVGSGGSVIGRGPGRRSSPLIADRGAMVRRFDRRDPQMLAGRAFAS